MVAMGAVHTGLFNEKFSFCFSLWFSLPESLWPSQRRPIVHQLYPSYSRRLNESSNKQRQTSSPESTDLGKFKIKQLLKFGKVWSPKTQLDVRANENDGSW